MRKIIVLISLTLIFGIIIYVFWQEELKYTLPTPVPEDYVEIPLGACVNSPDKIEDETITFIHFFNPDCPCSRFNLKHFHSIYRSHKEKVNFYVVVPRAASHKKARRLVSDDIPILIDEDKALRQVYGVYATPQAVILDHQEIYYRGNYNKARFCTLPGSNYAKTSLEMLLQGEVAPIWGEAASIAYGCQLPDSLSETSSFDFIPLIAFE